VLGGHTHRETDRVVGGTWFVKPGSVSNHDLPDKRARYLLMAVEEHRHRHNSARDELCRAIGPRARNNSARDELSRYWNAADDLDLAWDDLGSAWNG
jgi:hypothetical protein